MCFNKSIINIVKENYFTPIIQKIIITILSKSVMAGETESETYTHK